jgi:hypothetical protein
MVGSSSGDIARCRICNPEETIGQERSLSMNVNLKADLVENVIYLFYNLQYIIVLSARY